QDTVRFEMLEHFGAFPTESSHHMSEYVPYFRTDEATIEAMTGERRAHRMPTATYLEGWTEKTRRHEAEAVDPDELAVERSHEYASRIVHSMETGEPRRLNLNVRNHTAIRNLPEDALVEVPCLVDGTGVHPCEVGDLPAHLAALNRSNVAVQEQAVRAALDGDRAAVHRAVKLDPLTGACLTLDEAAEMTEELLAANADYLPFD
ncbi:MAG: alpha-glucosidase/alpha-galactosidase, partial [Halobacteriaceae archaeon]